MTRFVAAVLLSCAAAGGEPQLAPPNLAPTLLDDSQEIERYLDAFGPAEYRIIESPRPPYDCPWRGWMRCVRIWWNTPYIGRFYVEPLTRDLIKRIMLAGRVWEPHIVAAIEQHAAPGSVTLDLGAYIGTHAVLMGRLVGRTGRVYAFEPQREVFRELHHNVRLNGLGDVVVPLRYALGAKADVVEMNLVSEYGDGINVGGVGVGSGGDRVEMRTLDSFGFENVTLVKIDVEGFEDAVLAGTAQTIRSSKPVILIEILGGVDRTTASAEQRQRIDATVRTIEAFGYRVDTLPSSAQPSKWHDYIALPE